ncbi:beta-phosphoglucomutase family hydrolase [Mycolicibacterium farcinogenes]|uniref:Beta-phosphoglucomutase n=1 Tax=Mycolicibacterium senegalense TaxID=1796 RepID=A0A378W4Z6_9MYCO|nr:beta-phosphoglucomutase family hydrolase [Mycolicibacterium farcinogenes]SUA27462.1 HAD-superfamily hydrolase subfamily IA, variant 3 :Beta-phosphoglucomutase hydrolase [Mycolicibacterium senegalense]
MCKCQILCVRSAEISRPAEDKPVFKTTYRVVITHDGEDVGESEDAVLGLPEQITACLFDLDGVLTDTASVHKKAWKAMFDEYLKSRAERTGEPFTAFDIDVDYLTYVDGKRRQDGVRSFLASRGIEVPEGTPDDPADAETIEGLGTRKNAMFHKTLEKDGVEVFEGSRRYLQAVTEAGLRRAVVSSSANTEEVLRITGLDTFIEQRVDGVTMRDENIPGKPAPDSFLRAAELLDVSPAQAAVFEDALAGVAAGRAGKFGFVVGVDRVGQAGQLRRDGADVVVTDLAELM